MMPGAGPRNDGRVVRPDGLVMMRRRRAVDRLEDRAEELARFQVIDDRGHRPPGLTWDSRSWVDWRVLPVEWVCGADSDCSPQPRATGP
jgi:hypothetical protein